ncbi:MAG: methionine--tRNA ligase, partial [Rectinemataceae bacterium]
GMPDEAFWAKAREIEARTTASLERADLRDAFRAIFELSDIANKRFQDGEPWKTRISDPEAAASLVSDLCYVLRDIAVLSHPYMPRAAEKLAAMLGQSLGRGGLDWSVLGERSGLLKVGTPEVLFAKLDEKYIAELRDRYSGSQKDRAEREETVEGRVASEKASPEKEQNPAVHAKAAAPASPEPVPAPAKPIPYADLPLEQRFGKLIALKVAKIVKIERHPKADKLYIETLDDGSDIERVIVSGLVPFYREEELLGQHIILVDNLKPAKLRGIESRGMLLAASLAGPEGKEAVEVLSAPWAAPGAVVTLEGLAAGDPAEPQIDVDSFFSVPLLAKRGFAMAGGARLVVDGKPLSLVRVPDGEIG